MRQLRITDKILRNAVCAVLLVLACNELVNTFFFIRPFWIDEWRIIYNLKTRSLPQLWAQLDFLQQAPRTYLSALKIFAGLFDYSYSSLRVPSFLVGCSTILLSWRLMRRIFPDESWLQYLFPLIVCSSVPFTKYFIQVKQYTMDIALSLVAIWQLLELLQLIDRPVKTSRYTILCVSIFLAPFLSYTYPIAAAPVFPMLAFIAWKSKSLKRILPPLMLGFAGIVAMYVADVRQLLADEGMSTFWRNNFSQHECWADRMGNLYYTFANAGAGFAFQLLLALLGLLSFGKSWFDLLRGRVLLRDPLQLTRCYATLLISLVYALFLAGKLPLGESRLNAFVIPAVALLVIHMLNGKAEPWLQKIASGITAVLYLGLAGNIITTIIGSYSEPHLSARRNIYFNSGLAIRQTRAGHIPLFATPRVAFPYNTDPNLPDTLHTVPGDWVLTTHPAFHFRDGVDVYPCKNLGEAGKLLVRMRLPAALVCDGDRNTIIRNDAVLIR